MMAVGTVVWVACGTFAVAVHATSFAEVSREYDVFALFLGPLAPVYLVIASLIRRRHP